MVKNGVSGVYRLLLFFITVTVVVVNVQLDFNSYSRAVFLMTFWWTVKNNYNIIGPVRPILMSGHVPTGRFIMYIVFLIFSLYNSEFI